MDDGWIEWNGGDCPVPAGQMVEYRFSRYPEAFRARAGDLRWGRSGFPGPGDIVAYKVVQPFDDAPAKPDMVNSPPHYTQGGIETIQAIRAALTPEEFRGYCKGSVMAYVWRERHKGGDEDLGKSVWYLNKLLEAGS